MPPIVLESAAFHAFHVMTGITSEADEALDALAGALRAHRGPEAERRAA